jgi:mannose-6-phosphate isomerase
MPVLKPCLLDRRILPKIWGGDALHRLYGIGGTGNGGIGETWELYDRPDGSSQLRGSAATLRQWMEQDARALLGAGVEPGFGGRFPLLLKYIDARDGLSLQVHPDDAQAAKAGDGGKSEAWVVLDVGPKARIVRGCKPGVDRAQFARVAATAAVETLVATYTPQVGDCIHIPPGTVHAVGPDVVLFEVQQNSDITWRIYDWGRGRELHLEQALAAVRIDEQSPPTVAPRPLPDGGELVLQVPQFRVRRYRLRDRRVLETNGTFVAVSAIEGRGVLGWHSGGADQPLYLQPGDTALVPACVPEIFLSPIGALQVLLSDPGVR